MLYEQDLIYIDEQLFNKAYVNSNHVLYYNVPSFLYGVAELQF